MAELEALQLGLDAERADLLRTDTQVVGRTDVDEVAVAEVEAAAVERADVGQRVVQVRDALVGTDKVGTLQRRIGAVGPD